MNQLQQNQQQVEQCFIYPITCLTNHELTLICRKNQLESTFIEIINSKKSNIAIGCVYKHPNMDVLDFNSLNNQLLDKISKEQKQIFLLGDFNINLLNDNQHQPTNEFLDCLASNCIISYILQPTRITSHSKILIGSIFCNVFSAISGNITATISDHLPQFLFAPMCFQILYAINQTSWKEIGQNLTKEILFLITLIKIGLKFSNLISIM